ncbi:MAG: ATP synthase F1 subunit delta [Bacteroidetes bacterium GWC2_33_15]|nr:MAG: ATP synthase F1 subunit delta [Bacteroidetes bacterium GWA2_33_15]OFX50888.1 MAG: ATP synthase F1 subunit delta [Bacteroidetes bacterium GWC2_33_15]OFX62829.1 MAG: ATP synthase F1 subunit delta [Bacteroidetes bacterium GWB2_32_14]OFX69899.1 MAG: ATP synthase F1 subunit delta [Bacteroidetes bacterium GWD2_33_33]HAN18889.1 ATP synthase F1 subunit delta [Bacteroidales bacterium]
MYHSQINIRYAKAILLIAKEKGIQENIKNDAEFILSSVNSSDDFMLLLEHPAIKPSEKIKAFEALFKSNIDNLTISFLKLIIQNKREIYLKRILQNVIDIYKKDFGIKPVVITTAYTLNDEEITHLKSAIEKKLNSPVELTDKVDDSIIGGMIIQIEDKELDVSVRNQLQKFKLNLVDFDLNSKKRKII